MTPKTFGVAVVIYALVMLIPGARIVGIVALFMALWPAVENEVAFSDAILGVGNALSDSMYLVYLAGGIAFLCAKRWGRGVIVGAAFGQIAVTVIVAAFIGWMALDKTAADVDWPVMIFLGAFEAVIGIGVPAAIAFFAWRLRFDAAPAAPSPRLDDEAPPAASASAPPNWVRPRLWFWIVIGWGAVLPWLTGIVVWVVLRMAGRPVIDIIPIGKGWEEFLWNLVFYAVVAAVFASPFIVYAFVLRSRLGRSAADPNARDPVQLAAVAGGFVALTIMMIGVLYVFWQSPDGIMILMAAPFYLLLPVAIAGFVGMKAGELIARFVARRRAT